MGALTGRIGQAEPAQLGDDGLLDPPGVPGGVLGLDGQEDGPRAAGDQVQERGKGQDPARIVGQHVLAGPGLEPPVGQPTLPQRTAGRARSAVLRPGLEVVLAQVGQRLGRHHPPAIARAVDPAVVDADEVPVSGQANIALQAISTLVYGQLIGGEGVLGLLGAGTSVGDHKWTAGHGPPACPVTSPPARCAALLARPCPNLKARQVPSETKMTPGLSSPLGSTDDLMARIQSICS